MSAAGPLLHAVQVRPPPPRTVVTDALRFRSAQAQQKTDIVSALNNNGHKLAVAVLDIAGVTTHASDPKARYTFLL